MRRLLIALLTCLILPIIVVKTNAQDNLAKSLLWEISGNGLDQPSYVFGTIHMIDQEYYFLTEAAENAFDKSQNVTFEIDMEEMTDIGVIMPLLMQAFMKGDTTLSDLLNEEDYKMVANHFQQIGLPMMMVERIKPMFLSALAAGDMSNPTAQQEVVSYEMELMKMAEEQDKEIMGLETAEYQMSMFDSIPYTAQAQMLLESIQGDSSEGTDQLNQMIELYINQDIEGMQVMMNEDNDIMEYQDLLLIARNKNWIPIMEKRMKTSICFFAVGAGHLGGNQGVLRLLQAAGYNIKPLF
ncbi:MAG: TraB/GumN family protein [Saprospiraceae bacterium]|nr:TraB/GumN family protein [Saprospiraceae bacterium]